MFLIIRITYHYYYLLAKLNFGVFLLSSILMEYLILNFENDLFINFEDYTTTLSPLNQNI